VVSPVELHHGAATDVGLVREVNEDAYLAAPPVFVVADGMGGHEGGDVASAIVVEEFGRLADEGYDPRRGAEVVAATLRTCQERITGYAAGLGAGGSRRFRSGTTAVVALLVEDDDGPKWLLANLGDSRIYRYADGVLERVSVDHSVVQELVDAGQITEEQSLVHPERHIVTRALGGPDPLDPDFFSWALTDAERILLCSDGVTDLVRDHLLADLLRDNPDPRDAADQVVATALAAGGIDNATAVVVDVVGLTEDRTEQNLGALP